MSKNSLMQQNIELRRRLEDEHSHYKTKLQSYQDSQQRQAQLVQKLQAKVSREGSGVLKVSLILVANRPLEILQAQEALVFKWNKCHVSLILKSFRRERTGNGAMLPR